jgi:restriction endonuclease S subunit
MQCFVVLTDKIERRLDPYYYRPDFNRLYREIQKLKYETIQVKDIADVICGPFGSSIKVKDYVDCGVPLVRIANIDENQELLSKEMTYITKDLAKRLESYQIKKGDLVISQRGTLGLVVKITDFFNGGIISANFIAIKNLKEVTPNYLKVFLSSKYGRVQLIRKISGQVQTKITTEDIKSIMVPIPPLETQNQIVNIMQSAYHQKKQKETEAQKLLDSVNNYVLDELGIKLPELKDKMCYVVNADEVESNRADAYYYQPKFKEIEKSTRNGKYKINELKDTFEGNMVKGLLPSDEEKDGDVKVLQIRNILKNGLMDLDEYTTAKNIFSQEHKINKDDVIVVITGATIGKVGLWNSKEEFYLGGDMVKFKTNNNFNPYYVQAFLLSNCGQYQLLREITGATNKHLSPDDVRLIKIPTPPIGTQNKIAEEVKSRQVKAKQLQEEAKQILEQAKQEVEKIILD